MSDRYTAAMPSGVTRRLLTTTDYNAMIDAGILGPDDHVELLAGEIYEAASQGSPHTAAVLRLIRWFSAGVGERALVNAQGPIQISDLSEPEPDLSLLAFRDNFYADRKARTAETLLVVEVAVSSYDFDRNFKLHLYAEAGIREVWIVALERAVVEVFRDPVGDGYRQARTLRPGDTVAPAALPDLEVDVSYLLG